VTGRAALRDALSGFLALKPQDVRFSTVAVVAAGDVALTRSRWSMAGRSSEGDVVLDHHGIEVMRRSGADGAWRFSIDDPFAGDAAAARR
jgi:ketosteroid isomerase-like protein